MSKYLKNESPRMIGRGLLSLLFLWSGYEKVLAYSAMTGYVAAKGLPYPGLAVATAAAIEILGGLALLSGFRAKIASWVLLLYLIPTTLLFHNFWAWPPGMQRMDLQVHFFKNLAIMGGMLILATNGASGRSLGAPQAGKA
jgi:putative oxidoreductase